MTNNNNGLTAARCALEGISVTHEDDGLTSYLDRDEAKVVRDLILAELGLWRDDETGALVVTDSWDGKTAAVIYKGESLSGMYPYWDAGLEDDAVARWRASLTPPPREPKPGEVWRVTLEDGSEHNVFVAPGRDKSVYLFWVVNETWRWRATSDFPAERRRLLVEADGTVVAGDE